MKANEIHSIQVLFASRHLGISRLSVVLMAATVLGVAVAAEANGLVLWNRLGSVGEILNSEVGPGLEFYEGGDIFSVPATPAFVPGMFGNALSIGPGSYSVTDRVHNAVFNNVDQYLNAERGTVEAWYQQGSDPIPYQHGVHRIFDGGFGLASGLGLESLEDGLHFNVAFGGTLIDLQHGISAYNSTWIHLAGVWDRAGIGGSADAVRLYVNGTVVSSTSANSWGNTVGTRADIAGANDNDIAGRFYVDNLKVWDHAVTDFSHRLDEAWGVPEPATAVLFVLTSLPLMLLRYQRCHAPRATT